MEILVFGAGAIGSFFGGLLSGRHDVTLVGRTEHIAAIRSRGLRISGKTAMMAKPRASTRVPSDARPEIVFVTTKAYDTANAMLALEGLADRSTFVTLQNGLGNTETIAKVAPRVVAGTTEHGVMYLGPGEIRHAGVGETVLGAWTRMEESILVRVRDVLADVGLVARITSDVRTELWSKLVVNAAINPLAAIADVPNGRLVRDKRLLAVLETVSREATAVAKAEGARVDPEELRHRTVLVAKRTAANRGSMLQDLERHRRTEIEAITGAVV
ncbi:MAG: 2-dehydropantoate 2-reductase, partial [Thermoplasmata archaeon]|nr:2-dehydropantoate 2-reductase [Thermoplasmata archaeon]